MSHELARVGRRTRSKGAPGLPAGRTLQGPDCSPPPLSPSTLVSATAALAGGMNALRAGSHPRSPSGAPPRRGTPCRQSGCFSPSGNPAHGGLPPRLPPRFDPSSRSPSRSVSRPCDRGARAFFVVPLVTWRPPLTRQAPETTRSGSTRDAFRFPHRPCRSAPEGFYDRSARGLLCRELPSAFIAHRASCTQQKNHLNITFFLHRFLPQVLHRETKGFRSWAAEEYCLMSSGSRNNGVTCPN